MVKRYVFFLMLLFFVLKIHGQSDTMSIYHVDRLKTGIIGVAGIGLHQWGLYKQRQAPKVAEQTVLNLRPEDVYNFDQVALRQDYAKRQDAAKTSDMALNISLILPVSLLLDGRIRQDWGNVLLMYVEAQALSNNLYAWSPFGPTFVDRMRPVAYYSQIPLPERMDNKSRQSFFSGHVSSVATGTFFMAKVYNDYHPSSGAKKWIVYGLAAVPPTFVGIYRVKALRHFPSDIVVGGIIGAASGIVIPQLHKRWQNKIRLSLIYGEMNKGMSLSLKF